MRKHFLILMLMALLPLAGWALAPKPVTIQCANIEFIYGDDDIPDNNTTAEAYMIGIVSNPDGATIDQIAAALKFQRIGSTSKAVNEFGYSYRLIQDPAYAAGEVDVTITGGNGTLYINKRPITITVDDMSKTFGEENPAFTAGITSGTMLGEEELTYTVVRTSTSENRGVYDDDLTISLTEDEVSANYEITVDKGQFTINPKPLAADKLSITLSQSVYTYTGLACKPTVTVKDADTDEELVLNQDFSVNYYNNTDVPVLPDVTRLKVKAVATGNYTFDDHNEYYTINKAPLTISAQADSKTYGEPNPTAYVPVYTGFVNGETADALVIAGKFTKPTVSRAAGENVGSYDITVAEDATAANYAITYQNLTAGFEIKQKELNEADFTFELAAGPYTYDGHAKTPTITTHTYDKYDGTNPVDIVPTAMATPNDYTFVYDNNENAGVNTAQVIITGQGNFKGSIIKTFSIAKADIYIQPANDSKDYSDGDPAYLDGETAAPADKWSLVNLAGDPVEGAALNGTVKLARVAGENVSSYTIYVESYTAAANDNYEAKNVFNDPNDATTANKIGVFQINPKGNGLVLKFKDDAVKTKVYGDADPVWTINDLEYVSGKVGDDTWETIKPTLSAPVFNIASQQVVNDEPNTVTVTGLASANYPSVTVQPMAFTVTARPIAVTVNAQVLDYGTALTQGVTQWDFDLANTYGGDWNGTHAAAAADTKEGLNVTLSTINALGTYGPSDDAYVKVIKATSGNTNYVIDEDPDVSTWGNLTVNGVGLVLMASDNDVFTKITANNNQTLNVQINFNARNRKVNNAAATPTHTWAKDKWNALILPFDITVAELSNRLGYANNVDAFNYVVVNTLKKDSPEGKFQFELATGLIEANTPIMVKTIGNITTTDATELATVTGIINFGNKKIKAPAANTVNATMDNGFKLVGQYANYVLDKDKPHSTKALYRFLYGDDDSDFKGIGATSENTWTIVPFDCYVDLTGNVEAAAYVVFEFEEADGTTTTIKSIEANNSKVNAEGWYTINGVKLNAAPTEKGIYINNGKKVVLK